MVPVRSAPARGQEWPLQRLWPMVVLRRRLDAMKMLAQSLNDFCSLAVCCLAHQLVQRKIDDIATMQLFRRNALRNESRKARTNRYRNSRRPKQPNIPGVRGQVPAAAAAT